MNTRQARQPSSAPFDTWTVLDLLILHWRRIVAWTLVAAVAGALVARAVWSRSFSSTAQLIHYEASSIDDSYHPRALGAQSLVVMLQSPALFEEVGSHMKPAVSAKELSDVLELTLDRNNDVVTVTATGRSREEAVDIVNRFCAAAIAYTQTMQRQEANEAGDNVNRQLGQVESEIESTYKVIPAASETAVASVAAAPEQAAGPGGDLSERIQHAKEELNDLLMRYTDAHPLVIEQRLRLASLQAEETQAPAQAAGGAGVAAPSLRQAPVSVYTENRITPEEVAMGERLRTLEANRELLVERARAIQPFRDSPPGYFRVLQSAASNPTQVLKYRLESILFACLGAFLGFVGAAGQVVLGEFLCNRISTRSDVRRVTGLPLLAAAGNLKLISAAAQGQWALRAWTAVQASLGGAGRGAVCGFTCANGGDGRTTWINLLSRGAGSRGFRVIAVTPQPAKEAAPLSSPGQAIERLRADDGAVVGVALPAGGLNAQLRGQLRSALEAWKAVDNLVVLVELPPASAADCVLLAGDIPNLVWVANSGTDATQTIEGIESLRDAGCNLVGAVLNRESPRPLGGRFSRWIGSRALLLLLGALLPASVSRAADEPAPSAGAGLTDTGPSQRGAWQQRLTLGPGDVLTFHLYGSPELTREKVPIGPDGRVSYLEAENINASGLTIDELRGRINAELGRYRRTPEAYITPDAYRSKKYYVLGTVVQKGVFYLDRPTTVVEAVARARGFVTGVSRGDTVDATDFSHSFLERGGRRVPVDFAGLFLHGDLSQNVPLEPNDYLYFPPSGSGEIYVLGEVGAPGPVSYDPDVSAMSAIASRGGFTPKAWKARVLVVRQSLDHPVAFKVDIDAALAGNAPNLALQPGDLVYVANRPWIRAEEMLDLAATAFAESAVVTWTGLNVGPNLISKPNLQ